MISHLPWLIIPVIVYNIIAFGFGAAPVEGETATVFDSVLFSLTLISGAVWSMKLGDIIIILSLLILFVELVKATRTSSYSIVDHGLSMVVFIVCIIEFLAVKQAATSVFFIIMIIVLIDVIAGFTITIRAAKRDVAFGSADT